MERNEINYLLHEKRVKKGESLKDASIALGCSAFRLNLIEHGYLRPHSKLKKKMISHYKLSDDFFTKNSRHIYPIDKEEPKQKSVKLFNFLKSRKCKIINFSLLAGFSVVLFFGIRNVNYRHGYPEAFMTQNLKGFMGEMKVKGEKRTILKSTTYVITKEEEHEGSKFESELVSYEDYCDAQNITFNFKSSIRSDVNFELDFSVGTSGKNIIIMGEIKYPIGVESSLASSYDVLAYFNNAKTVSVYSLSRERYGKFVDKSSEEFKTVATHCQEGMDASLSFVQKNFFDSGELVYKNAEELLLDINKVCSGNTSKYRSGVVMLITTAVGWPISLFFLIFSFILSIKPKEKKVREYNKKQKELKQNSNSLKSKNKNVVISGIPYRSIPNDWRFTPFFPETFLKIVGIALILMYSIAMNMSMYNRLFINYIIGSDELNTFQKYASNLLIGGVLLHFFVKLDINHQKSQKQLIFDIALMFVCGLMYYLAEVSLFNVVSKREDLFSAIFSLFINFIPGNIFWSLMLYSCVYYFLFITPKNLEKDRKKLIAYKCLSLIPTGILIFSFIFKFFINNITNLPYYITCLFYSKNAILTFFAILYLYSLFFLRSHYFKKYGVEQCNIYFNSSRYNMAKNILACVIVVILFGFDLWCKYNLPSNNVLKLGTNWSIIILVPFVLFFRSHIGKRNKKLDNTMQVLYIVSLGSTYVILIFMFILRLNLGVLLRFLG